MSEVNKVIYGDDTLIDLTADTVTEDNLLDGVTAHAADGSIITGNVITHDVIDNVTSTSKEDALSANQGKLLNDKIKKIENILKKDIYTPSAAIKEATNVSLTIPIKSSTDYLFATPDYSWTAVYLYDASGTETRRMGNGYSDKQIEFTTTANEVSGKFNFFPGDGVTVDDTDFTNVHLWEYGTIGGGGSETTSLISTDISDILLTASTANPIEIVLMGDSITEGYSATGMSTAGSVHPVPTWANYPSWAGLLNKYITANFPNVTVTNRGYSGQISGYGAENVDSWITNDKQIAIVMYGTNNRTTQAYMDALAGDYTTIMNRCNTVGAKMVPMCCIPTTPYNQSISGKYVGTMPEVHNILTNWAKDNGYELIDLYDMMMTYINNDTDNLETMDLIYVGSADNNLHIHPSDHGHAVMFSFIQNRLGISAIGGGSSGTGRYRHRVSLYCLSGGTTYVVLNFYNNRSTPYNVTTTTTTAEIETFKDDLLNAGYTTAIQKGILMCSGTIAGTPVYGLYMGTDSSGLSAVSGKLNFVNGTNFNLTLPLETGGTSSASTSLRLWDTVEDTGSGGGGSGSGGGSTVSVLAKTTEGTNIASITVDGTTTQLYAPTSGGGGGTWNTNTSVSGCRIDELNGLCIINFTNCAIGTNGYITLPITPVANYYGVSGIWDLNGKRLIKANFETNKRFTISTVDTDTTITGQTTRIFGTFIVRGTLD